jgi:hypothetical protein
VLRLAPSLRVVREAAGTGRHDQTPGTHASEERPGRSLVVGNPLPNRLGDLIGADEEAQLVVGLLRSVEVEVDAAPPRARRAASLSLCPPPTPPCRVAHAQSRSSRTGVSVSCFLPRLGRGGERGAAGARRQGQELVYCITMWKKKLKVCQAVAVAHHSTASCTQQQRGRVCGGTCMRRRD